MAAYQENFTDSVISLKSDGGVEILPKGGNAETGIIFYVGAQITPDAYIPLLSAYCC